MSDMPLDAPNIAAWLNAHDWMRKSRRPTDRLLYRVMRLCLTLLSEKQMTGERKFQNMIGK